MQDWFVRFEFFGIRALNLIAIVAALCTYNVWAIKASVHDATVRAQIAQVEQAALRGPYATDGTFEGTAQGYRGPITMRVTVDSGHISDVAIVEAPQEDNAYLAMCAGLPAKVVEAQATTIDVVSGATYTSRGILAATAEALKASMGGESS